MARSSYTRLILILRTYIILLYTLRYTIVVLTSNNLAYITYIRRSRVIGDYGGYRRLIVYFAVFGREGLG